MNDVIVDYRAVGEIDGTAALSAMHALSPERRERFTALPPAARARSLTGDSLARELAALFCGVDAEALTVLEMPGGKPYLANIPAHISISHAASYAAAAAAARPVGVDIERLRPFSPALARRVCTAEELAWADEDASRLLRLWTMREAYGKLRGTGVFTKSRFHARFRDDRLCRDYEDCCFRFPAAPPGYLLTVCCAFATGSR